MNRTLRRVLTTAGATTGALALFTGTAAAHYCYQDAPAKSQGVNGNAWVTPAEWAEHIQYFGVSPECGAALEGYVLSLPDGTRLMGPGLLAGGTLHNGKGKTPAQFDYVPFPQLCPGDVGGD